MIKMRKAKLLHNPLGLTFPVCLLDALTAACNAVGPSRKRYKGASLMPPILAINMQACRPRELASSISLTTSTGRANLECNDVEVDLLIPRGHIALEKSTGRIGIHQLQGRRKGAMG